MRDLRIGIEQRDLGNRVSISIFEVDHDMGKIVNIVDPESIKFIKYDQSKYLPSTFEFETGLANRFPVAIQNLLESLWRMGIRPNDFRDVNPLVESKDDHIGDLRKICFKKLGIELDG